jgi:HSP20 family molecular chaperone IbpA
MNAITQPRESKLQSRQEAAMWPPVDVIEDPTGITLYADLPGVPRDKLSLRVDGDTLNIEAEVALTLPKDMEASHAEVNLARFRRAFLLTKELDAEKVNAELSQGVLRVRIPKAAHAQPRKIAVNVG